MAQELVNVGFLHTVKCEWCEIVMSCNCWDGSQADREGHILVLCPRCQVTNYLNVIFGGKDLRSLLVSRIAAAGGPRRRRQASPRPALKLVADNARAHAKGRIGRESSTTAPGKRRK